MYLDSSIIIKLLVDEPDSAFFTSAILHKLISSSELAVTEVRAALFSKQRGKLLDEPEQQNAWSEFSLWMMDSRIEIHPLNSVVMKRARNALERCHPEIPLRTLDAIHLAACDQSQDFPLCTTDKWMREAAGILHIPVFPE